MKCAYRAGARLYGGHLALMFVSALAALIILADLFGCTGGPADNLAAQNGNVPNAEKPFAITAIDAKFPLRLDKLKLESKNNTIHLNDGTVAKIEAAVKEYAKDFEFHGGFQTYKNTYINTIRLKDSLRAIYLVLLMHYPTAEVNALALFHDDQNKTFADNGHECKIHALYEFDNGNLLPTNLKTEFHIISPEIETIDFDKDGMNDYKFTRLYHNGTANAIETTIIKVSDNKLDTLEFKRKWLGMEGHKP
jgi:hypothetical protein